MTSVSEKVTALVRTMCATDEYRTYKRLQRQLDKDEDLKRRVDEYRAERFAAGQVADNLMDRMDEVRRRHDDLLSMPGVRAYLDAENAVCRMIREVYSTISAEVAVTLPGE